MKNFPQFVDYLTDTAKIWWDTVCQKLKEKEITYVIDTKLVRGLDYYNHTVFEWVHEELNLTILGGGRYNGLVEVIQGQNMQEIETGTQAIGFALGIERIILALDHEKILKNHVQKKVVILNCDESPKTYAWIQFICKTLRTDHELCIDWHMDGPLKKRLSFIASLNDVDEVLLVGENEANSDTITVKYLEQHTQETLLFKYYCNKLK